jgi:hypothetical protein
MNVLVAVFGRLSFAENDIGSSGKPNLGAFTSTSERMKGLTGAACKQTYAPEQTAKHATSSKPREAR